MVTYSDMLKMSAQEMFDMIDRIIESRCVNTYCDGCPFCSGENDCGFSIANFSTDNSSSKEPLKPDAVHNPTHYTSGGIECWDAMQAAFGVDALKDFCLLNAFKYLWRTRQKNGIEDIDKAVVYLEKYKQLAEVANESTENGTT